MQTNVVIPRISNYDSAAIETDIKTAGNTDVLLLRNSEQLWNWKKEACG